MALDAPSEQDSATLLNDVDRFQEAILAVLDELEGTYRREEATVNGGKVAAKREEDAEGKSAQPSYNCLRSTAGGFFLMASQLTDLPLHTDIPPPSKIRRYMLHRTLVNGDDIFTSAAVLSDVDLEAVSKREYDRVCVAYKGPSDRNRVHS